MTKTICFLYTETNGLHKTQHAIYKKNLYLFARPVVINYIIGTVKDNLFNEIKNIKMICKPRCMHITDESIACHGITNDFALDNGIDPEECINTFLNDIKKVDIIISHNINFHLKTIIAEALKYNIDINFNNYIIIDTINFYHKYGFINLHNLANNLKIKEISDKTKLELTRDVFFKLYSKYIKYIN
jgi:DNA polymerase III epsilon subunit-like protein